MSRRLVIIRFLRRATLSLCLLLLAAWLFSLFWWIDYVGPHSRIHWRHGALGFKNVTIEAHDAPLAFLDDDDDEFHEYLYPPEFGWRVYPTPWFRDTCEVSPLWWVLSAWGPHRNELGYGYGRNYGDSVALAGSRAVLGTREFTFSSPEKKLLSDIRIDGAIMRPVAGLVPIATRRSDTPMECRLAMSEDTLIVGGLVADRWVAAESSMKSAALFELHDDRWVQQPPLIPPRIGLFQNFGDAVAIAGNLAVCGAPDRSKYRDGPSSAWVFRRTGETWAPEQELLAPSLFEAWDEKYSAKSSNFGVSVAIDRDTILVAAPTTTMRRVDDPPVSTDEDGDEYDYTDQIGTVFVFRHSRDGWYSSQYLRLKDTLADPGFGSAIDLEENIAVVAAEQDDRHPHGDAHVFRYDGNRWVYEQPLPLPPEIEKSGPFAEKVAIDNGTIFATAVCYSKTTDFATVCVYEYNDSRWQFTQQLKRARPDPDYRLTETFAVHNDCALVGASFCGQSKSLFDDDETGAVYLFKKEGRLWTQTDVLQSICHVQHHWHSVFPAILALAILTPLFAAMERRIATQMYQFCLRCRRGKCLPCVGRCGQCETQVRRVRRKLAYVGLGCGIAIFSCCLASGFIAVSYFAGVRHIHEEKCYYGADLGISGGNVYFDRVNAPSDLGGCLVVEEPASHLQLNFSMSPAYSLRLPSLNAFRDGFVIPLWLPCLLFALYTFWLFRRSRRPRPGHCPTCGYNLTGNNSGICPECGSNCTAGDVPAVAAITTAQRDTNSIEPNQRE